MGVIMVTFRPALYSSMEKRIQQRNHSQRSNTTTLTATVHNKSEPRHYNADRDLNIDQKEE